MKELHVCPICKIAGSLVLETLHSTMQTNIGKIVSSCAAIMQAGINHSKTQECVMIV